MHDSNGKRFKVGDEFHTSIHGMCKVLTIASDHESMEAQAIKGGDGLTYQSDDAPELFIVRTWKELAADALQVQDACNLSGVVQSFARVITEVRRRLEFDRNSGTDAVNTHPICILYSDKIAHLTDTQYFGNPKVAKAYQWAYDMKGE